MDKHRIRVLDCTLRDGGCVNGFNFGTNYMKAIKEGLEASGVDIIECGYIDEKKGSPTGRTQFIDDKAVQTQLLTKKLDRIKYVAMIDYGKFDCEKLQLRSEGTIDGLRIAFHKKDRFDMLNMCQTVLKKGYDLFIQPMTIMRYTDKEILEFIEYVNDNLPSATAVYIVDSFGEMRMDDLRRILFLLDNNLNKDIAIGFHSHNNLQLSYANAIQVIEHRTMRDVIIDASVMGMGKGAGNLNTELLLDHLNHFYRTEYSIKPLLDVIDKVINQVRQKYRWGYSIEFFLSSKNSCTPSYAQHLYEKHLLTVEQISEILQMLREEKKISFDKEYAEKLYYEYNSRYADSGAGLEKLKSACDGKKVLLIAPGKSIVEHRRRIEDKLAEKDIVSIQINAVDAFKTDFVFINKAWLMAEARASASQIIALSNVGSGRPGDIILNYEQWVPPSEASADSSFVVLMKILFAIGVKDVYLAGFDGFDYDADKNYYSDELKRDLGIRQIDEINARGAEVVKKYSGPMCLEFVTPSKYQEI